MEATIYKIVTARNTSFIVGFPKDSAEDSPRIEKIQWEFNYDWHVYFSDGTNVSVSDVVEIWDR